MDKLDQVQVEMVTAAKELLNIFSNNNRDLWCVCFPPPLPPPPPSLHGSASPSVHGSASPVASFSGEQPGNEATSAATQRKRRSLLRKPPPSAKPYLAVLLRKRESVSLVVSVALEALKKGVKNLFVANGETILHNKSFWTTFLNTLHIEMSAGLVVRIKGRSRSEAEVRHELVSPLLRRLAHCVSSMAAPVGWGGEGRSTPRS